VLIEGTSPGEIWFQTPVRYDGTNLYLTASEAGVTATIQLWALPADSEIAVTAPTPLPPGGAFTIPNTMGVVPVLAAIQATSAGKIWFQYPLAFDASNLYLVASDAGVTANLELWASMPIPTSVSYAKINLAPSAPGNFSVAHGLSGTPRTSVLRMTSGGEIWLQATPYDATNVNLVASDGGITGVLEVWL
jgi:hypothetical protein